MLGIGTGGLCYYGNMLYTRSGEYSSIKNMEPLAFRQVPFNPEPYCPAGEAGIGHRAEPQAKIELS